MDRCDPRCQAMLDEALSSPLEPVAVLMLADWLEEQGEPERAEFLRVRYDLARLDATGHSCRAGNIGESTCPACAAWPDVQRPGHREAALLAAGSGDFDWFLPGAIEIRIPLQFPEDP